MFFKGFRSRSLLETPDEKFLACCQERGLPDACLDKCTFKTFTRAALQVKK